MKHDVILSETEWHQPHLHPTNPFQAVHTNIANHELHRLDRLKEDFLSTISHELRTPLSSMYLSIQLLDMLLTDEKDDQKTTGKNHVSPNALALHTTSGNPRVKNHKVRRYLDTLSQECKREIALVNNLLSLQEEMTQLPIPAFSCIFVQEWLHHFLSPFHSRFQHQQLTFQIKIADAPTYMTSDLIRCEKILHELLINASKFTPPGHTVSLSIEQHDSMLSIMVINDGNPIPEEELPKLFTIFHRVPHIDPWKTGGTGIGLALVKKLTETIGGRITVNTGDFGNAFLLQIPQPDSRC